MSIVASQRLDEIAQDLFGMMTQLALATQAHQRRGVNLKEFEYLTLAVLQTQDSMIVGNIQRILGVLPAQMSRIIRSLENRQQALIECQINPQDKRKVDVRLTSAGEQALSQFRELRVQKLVTLLKQATEDEQEDLAHLVSKLSNFFKENRLEIPGALVS